jgi:lipopolysaccharide export system protein LptA
MSRLMLIPALIAIVSTATAEQPADSGTPLAVTIGPFELSARSVEVKACSSQLEADEICSLNCSLSGDASIRIGNVAATADKITVAMDKAGKSELCLRGNCKLTLEDEDDEREFIAAADQISWRFSDHLVLLSGNSGSARLTWGDGEKATVIEASSIRFNAETRKVRTADVTHVQLGTQPPGKYFRSQQRPAAQTP